MMSHDVIISKLHQEPPFSIFDYDIATIPLKLRLIGLFRLATLSKLYQLYQDCEEES